MKPTEKIDEYIFKIDHVYGSAKIDSVYDSAKIGYDLRTKK
jgi:hypothetical protein